MTTQDRMTTIEQAVCTGVRNLRQCETAVANRFFFSIPFEATLFAHQNEFGFQIRIEDVLGSACSKVYTATI